MMLWLWRPNTKNKSTSCREAKVSGRVAHMKKGIHPENYRPVIFLDTSSGERFLIASTVQTTGVAKWEDGKEYPLYEVEISSASHPFYTGKENMLDTAGRVQKFKTRAAQKTEPKIKKVKKVKEDKKTE